MEEKFEGKSSFCTAAVKEEISTPELVCAGGKGSSRGGQER